MSPSSAFLYPDPVPLWSLPPELTKLAVEWSRSGLRVAARRDDANEWRIMKLRVAEAPWVGWREVDCGVRP